MRTGFCDAWLTACAFVGAVQMLDLGCGQGTNTIFLGSKGLDIVGIDLSPDAIAEAESRPNAAGVLHLPPVSFSLPGP